MKKFTISVKIVCFCFLFIFCGKIIQYLLIDDTSSYVRIMMHELYNQDSNIDILFVGSSHCYFSLVPEVTDRVFQKNTFDGGTAGQELDGSLEMIKEALKYNDIEQIYLDLYYDNAFKKLYKERKQMTATYVLADEMKLSVNKIRYLLNASSKEHYINSFIVARRNWEKFFESNYVFELLKKKGTKEYQSHTWVSTSAGNYVEKGYILNTQAVPEGTFSASADFIPIDTSRLSQDWESSLLEIIDLCNERGIKLTLISTPMSNFRLMNVGNYDDYVNYVNELIEGTGVKYYDFNLCKTEYIPDNDSLFFDNHHLNSQGAELFSEVFSRFFTGEISEKELFYSSYEEKIAHLEKDVFGVIVIDDKKNYCITIKPVTNASVDDISYTVIKNTDNKEPVTVMEKQALTNISYLEGEHGTCEIITYLCGIEKNHVNIEYGVLE